MNELAQLPELGGDRLFITDGGLETTLIFHEGFDLPHFAAFDLLKDEAGRAALERYYERYIAIAREHGLGMVIDTPTWRANSDWGSRLGYSPDELADANRAAVRMAQAIRERHEGETRILISGCMGPREDAYEPAALMSADEAEDYHAVQLGTLADAGADLVSALTLAYPEEAVGIVRAARANGLPAVISFTVETDGRLPNGDELRHAIEYVDDATGGFAEFFMINCAHPQHFSGVLQDDGPWRGRIRGLRANASKKSHAELDEAEGLDDGDPAELGADYAQLRGRLPNMAVLGGCCGTDHRHVGEVCKAWLSTIAR